MIDKKKRQLKIKVTSFDVNKLDTTCVSIASVMQSAFGKGSVSVFTPPCRRPLIDIKRSGFAYSNSVRQNELHVSYRCIRVLFDDIATLQKKLSSIELPEGVHLKSILYA